MGILTKILNKLHGWAKAHPFFVVAFVLLLVGSSASNIPKLRTLLSVHDFLPEQFESIRILNLVKEEFVAGRSMTLVFRSEREDGSFSEKELCTLREWLSRQAIENDEIQALSSPFILKKPETKGSDLYFRDLVPIDCDSPSSEATTGLLSTLADSPWVNLLTDEKGQQLSIEISFRDNPESTKFGSFDHSMVERIREDLEKSLLSEGNISLIMTGPAVYESYLVTGIKRYRVLNFILIFLIFGVCRLFLGTWRSGLLFIVPLLFTTMTLFGYIAWSGNDLDVLSNSLFIMIAVAALQDFVFLSMQQMRSEESWRETFKRFLLPGFFTSLTTMIGFGSLWLSPLDNVARFGIWAAMGAFLEWGMTFMFLPAVLEIFPRLGVWTNRSKVFRFKGAVDWRFLFIGRRMGRALGYGIFPLAIFSAFFLQIKDDPKHLLSKDHVFRTELEELKKDRGWEFPVSLIFEDYMDMERNLEIIRELEKDPVVTKVESHYDILGFLVKDLDDSMAREIRNQAMPKLDRYISRMDTGRVFLYLSRAEIPDINRLQGKVKTLCPEGGCYLAGPTVAFNEYVESISVTLFKSFTTCLLLVGLILLWLMYHFKVRHKLYIFVSAFWGPAFILIVLALFGVNINMVTSICATVLVGLTGDNAIQFIFSGDKRSLLAGMRDRAEGAITTAVIMSMTSLVFLGSYFRPTQILGLLLFAGFLSCVFGDYWILRKLVEVKSVTKAK